MWKVWFRQYNGNKVVYEGILTKEYKGKPNASKAAKKLYEDHPEFVVIVGQENPFED